MMQFVRLIGGLALIWLVLIATVMIAGAQRTTGWVNYLRVENRHAGLYFFDMVLHTELMVYPMNSFPESTLSPDGRRFIAEVTHNGRRVIAITDIATGAQQMFPKPNRRRFTAYWMPDNRRVMLLTQDDYTPTEALYLLDTDTGDTELLFEAVLLRAALSPDTQHVAYSNESGLYLVDRHTNTDTRLIEARSYEPHFSNLTFSPDGTQLMYFAGWSNGAYRDGLYLYDLTSGETLHIAQDRRIVDLHEAVWSPDGAQIALVAWTHTGEDILIADAHTGAIQQTIQHAYEDKGLFAWARR